MKHHMNNIIGERIRSERIRQGMSQDQLASAVGYRHRSSISSIELGYKIPPYDTLESIADTLGVSPAFLSGWD